MHFSTSSWNFCGAWPDLSGTMRGMLQRHQKDLRLKLELEQGMNKNWHLPWLKDKGRNLAFLYFIQPGQLSSPGALFSSFSTAAGPCHLSGPAFACCGCHNLPVGVSLRQGQEGSGGREMDGHGECPAGVVVNFFVPLTRTYFVLWPATEKYRQSKVFKWADWFYRLFSLQFLNGVWLALLSTGKWSRGERNHTLKWN